MKTRRINFILLCVLALTSTLFAQEPEQKTSEGAVKYDDLLKKVKGGDTAIDFQALRFAYAETDSYSPYGCSTGRAEMFKAFNDKDYKKSLKEAEKMMEYCYTEMNAHYIASISHRELNNSTKSEFHKAVYLGLVKSIIENGDGKSTKTAWTVISVPEEYAILSALGYRRTRQSLLNEDGSAYDMLEAHKLDNENEKASFYFNVDIVFKGYGKMLKVK